MRRRCCVEWLGHKEIRVTNFAHQATFDPSKFSGVSGVDLITLKRNGIMDTPPDLEVLRDHGDGTLSDPVQLIVIAKTKDGGRETIKSFNIHDGKEVTIEVNFPEDKPVRRR